MAVIPLVPRSASQIIGVVPVDTRDGFGFSLGVGAYRVKAINTASTWYWSDTDGQLPADMTEVAPGVEVSFTGPQAAIYCKGTEPISLQVTFDPPLAASPGDVTLAGVQTLTNKRVVPRITAYPDVATITLSADLSDIAKVAALSQDTTFANPNGTPTDGQRIELRITSAGVHALAYGGQFRSTVSYTLPTATLGAGATQRLTLEWIAAASKWDLVGYDSQTAPSSGNSIQTAIRPTGNSTTGVGGIGVDPPNFDDVLTFPVVAGDYILEADLLVTGGGHALLWFASDVVGASPVFATQGSYGDGTNVKDLGGTLIQGAGAVTPFSDMYGGNITYNIPGGQNGRIKLFAKFTASGAGTVSLAYLAQLPAETIGIAAGSLMRATKVG